MKHPIKRFKPFLPMLVAFPMVSGDIVGTVNGPDGKAIAGAIVVATPAAPNALSDTRRAARITRTDANGRYRLANMPPGAYGATATSSGLGSGFIGKLRVPEIGELRNVNFHLNQNGTTFCGRILKPGGAATGDLQLHATRISEDEGDIFYGEVVGDQYRISLSPGTYWLQLIAPGWEGPSKELRVPGTGVFADLRVFPIHGTLPTLAAELGGMVREDQDIRNRSINHPSDDSIKDEMRAATAKHESRMKKILKHYGWPGASLVGMKGSVSAWTLVQHGSSSFLTECLPLMKKYANLGELGWSLVALSIDRDLVHRGKKQIYGSQFRQNDKGELEPYPIEDESLVDQRRAEVGLEPLTDYKASLVKTYLPGPQAN